MFLQNFTKKYPKVKLIIEELTTEDIVRKLTDGHIDAAIAATPLENEAIKEKPLYYEPFVGLIPQNHRLFNNKQTGIDIAHNNLTTREVWVNTPYTIKTSTITRREGVEKAFFGNTFIRYL